MPKPVLEGQVKRVVVDEQQPKKNGTAVEGIKNGGNGNSSPAASINSAAADQKEETKNSPASKNSWAIPTNAVATPANKQGAREMGGLTIAGYNIGAFMDLGASSSSSFISHQIRRQQVRSMKNESDSEDVTKTEGETKQKKPWLSMVNNNVQSVNNSLVFGTRLVQGSPGVHINLYKNRK